MSLIFAGLAPHSPMLIPEIGKEKAEKLERTIKSLEEMEGDLYVLQPDTIFVISPHSPVSERAFSLNLATHFESKFEESGNPSVKFEAKCDMELVSQIMERSDYGDMPVPVNIITEPSIDHGVSVPLYFLTRHISDVKVVPISVSKLPPEKHLEFGNLLRDVMQASNKRIAIIASGDLSHSLSDESDHGMTPQGKAFDETVKRSIEKKQLDDIVKINPEVVEKSHECGWRPLLILIGALKGLRFGTKIYSYEAPFGAGCMVAQFPFQ